MQRMNILVMGLDRRPDEQGASRTDTMMIVSIALMSQTVSLLSLPRDLWVTIPGYDDDRINTAYLIGETQRYPGRGPALAKATVQANFGVPIHYYVIVDFVGFRRLVDELGGIDVDVPQDIRDETFPDDHDGYRMVYIPQGRWHLSGDLALDYVRTRHQDADFGRMRRQQQVMLALKDRALQTNTLAKLPTLWSLKSEVVQTDLSMDKALELAALAKDLPAANIHAVTIDEKMTTPMLVASSGAQVLWPDRAKIREVVEQLFR
jgi:LCP family protein required for cell wall assembly